MNKKSFFLDFSLLKSNRWFRAIFIARMLSVFALGMLAVGVPVQVQQMTGSTLQVGVAVTIEGVGAFIGLLWGGVLADRLDRRRLILFARGTCGTGFILLSLNAWAPAPSLQALWLLAAWDGFFGALGMTALMAAIPNLGGRENLAAAGALSMLTVRLGAIISPALGGLIIMAGGVGTSFAVAAAATLGTLIPLTRLPAMKPEAGEPEHPLRAMLGGVKFVVSHPVVGCVVLLGMLISMAGAIRILFPALAQESWQVGLSQVGLMYSAVPLGAMVGAVTSGWIARHPRPGVMLLISACAAFGALACLGLAAHFTLGLLALVCYGYFNAMASLLQFTLIQSHTPDRLLGRVNSLGAAQDVSGDSLGALGLGALGRLLPPSLTALAFGACALGAGVLISLLAPPLRRCRFIAASEEATQP
ncbi:enterobactin transporter EntS [Mixta tenebrionis]|uniref:Multidrug efflux pump Tap n=1 Tax=Mixta tenebrionis TaxID=2562439 RepID=A0A506VAU9_9GAMM|nr:enterobactin transporter EntS [Mixta tenebrionis]TPW42857.1 enterobactin transporter EntS [Mixta tenebrionis]